MKLSARSQWKAWKASCKPRTQVDAQKCGEAQRRRRYYLPLIRLDGDQEMFAEQFRGLLEQHLPGKPFYRAQSRLNLEGEAQGKSLLTKREERVFKVAMDHIQKKGFDPSLTFFIDVHGSENRGAEFAADAVPCLRARSKVYMQPLHEKSSSEPR